MNRQPSSQVSWLRPKHLVLWCSLWVAACQMSSGSDHNASTLLAAEEREEKSTKEHDHTLRKRSALRSASEHQALSALIGSSSAPSNMDDEEAFYPFDPSSGEEDGSGGRGETEDLPSQMLTHHAQKLSEGGLGQRDGAGRQGQSSLSGRVTERLYSGELQGKGSLSPAPSLPPPPPPPPSAKPQRGRKDKAKEEHEFGDDQVISAKTRESKPKRRHRRLKNPREHQVRVRSTEHTLDHYLALGPPRRFWPKQGYFENTYLGGDLGYREALRSTSSSFQSLMTQPGSYAWAPPFDPPVEEGMRLTSRLSHAHFERPQRMILQVGLRGSDRYGWRRPPLNLLVAVDPELVSGTGTEARHTDLVNLLLPLMRHLNAADQVGLAIGATVISPRSPDALKQALINPLKDIERSRLERQGWMTLLQRGALSLNRASVDPHRAPGAQAILLLCGDGCARHQKAFETAAHRLNLDGTLTSVIDRSTKIIRRRGQSTLWQIASKGHGGYWPASDFDGGVKQAIANEFERFSRVVARLLRINIKLEEGVELVEILGSRMLNQHQADRVKAREKAMDQRLSARMGIKSDRGEDDEGVQVVIPAFYGGDSHLIHLVLWVQRPGALAEVHLKYKDLVRARNASASTSVQVASRAATLTRSHQEVRSGASDHLVASHYLKLLEHDRPSEEASMGYTMQNEINIPRNLSRTERQLLYRSNLGRPMRY